MHKPKAHPRTSCSRHGPASIRCLNNYGQGIPGTSTQSLHRSFLRTSWILPGAISEIVSRSPICNPFIDITGHIVETKFIRLETPYRRREGISIVISFPITLSQEFFHCCFIRYIPRGFTISPAVYIFLSTTSCRILPLCLCGQAVVFPPFIIQVLAATMTCCALLATKVTPIIDPGKRQKETSYKQSTKNRN